MSVSLDPTKPNPPRPAVDPQTAKPGPKNDLTGGLSDNSKPTLPPTSGIYDPSKPTLPPTSGIYDPSKPTLPPTSGVFDPSKPTLPPTSGGPQGPLKINDGYDTTTSGIPMDPTLRQAVAAMPPGTLDPANVEQLNDRLSSMSTADRSRAVDFLTNQVFKQANADRALATYLDLKSMQDARPDRITNDVVEDLTSGVANERSQTIAGQEGILGHKSALDAAQALAGMSQADYDAVSNALDTAATSKGAPVDGADAQVERSLILKATAARKQDLTSPAILDRARQLAGTTSQPMNDITTFARQIRGKDPQDLINQSTVIDLNGGNGALQQRFKDSCVPTTEQIMKANADPVYSFKLHTDAIHSLTSNDRIGIEQKQILEDNGGVASTRRSTGSGQGVAWDADMMNQTLGPYANRSFQEHDVDDSAAGRQKALDDITQKLNNGEDVAIRIGLDGGGAHAQVLTDVRGYGDKRVFLLTDPWNGQTQWIAAKDIVKGHNGFGPGVGTLTNYFD